MGTEDEIKQTQQNIRDVLKTIGLSDRQFAARYFDDTIFSESEQELNQFYEKFKKQLTRSGKKAKVLGQLREYLRFICDMDEFKEAKLVAPRDINYTELEDDFRCGMVGISRSIDKALKIRSEEPEDGDDE